MDSFKSNNIQVEKANAKLRYRRIQRITTLFRFVELFVFLIVVSSFSTDDFVFPFKMCAQYLRRTSLKMISPRFVFILGNTIVIVLLLISGKFSQPDSGITSEFYDEFVERSRRNYYRSSEQRCGKEKKTFMVKYKNNNGVGSDVETKICRSKSVQNVVESVNNNGRELRRSMTTTERCRKVAVLAAADDMSSEEFRQTVEAFISRQQKFLREEEEFPA